ncbi:Abscisic acid 8'-hydroxylase CYP707A1 [Linum grandiflorum]
MADGFLVYILLVSILIITLSCYFFFATKPHKTIILPPGSMGWPVVGETLQLYSQDPAIFFSSKQKRYGEIFKTHILGCPCVMLASPEAARFVLVTQAHLFKPTYPKSKEQLIGPSAVFFHQGDYHLRLRKLVQGALSLDRIRNLVGDVSNLTVSALDSWDGGRVISTYEQLKMLSFEVGILAIFGHLEDHYRTELKTNYGIVEKGYNSFPTSIPGSPYKRALNARRKLNEILGDIISERKEKKLLEKDLLGCLLNSKNQKGEVLTDDQVSDNIIGVLFAAQDTTASAMTWIVKYLHDNPKLLEAVKVVLESLRMASIIAFTFREAVTDVEYKGYLIPKGWKVMPLFRNIHHNPEYFSDPHQFEPSRFEVSPKANTFMPFGNGVHACPGNELAKLEMLILIHHLVTKYRWEVVGDESGTQNCPFPVPMNGLPARFWKQHQHEEEEEEEIPCS